MISVVVTFIPVIATFGIAFLQTFHHITPVMLMVLIIISVANGFTEELFWRGTYFVVFADKRQKLAYIFPTI